MKIIGKEFKKIIISFGFFTLVILFPLFAMQAETTFKHSVDSSGEQEFGSMAPVGLLLQWQQDPTTTMTIDWHTTDSQRNPELEYQELNDEEWHTVQSTSIGFPFSKDRIIHRVELTNLMPATKYRFRVPGVERPYKFRTMPDNVNKPIRFATGGDTHVGEEFRKTNRLVAQYDPEFVLWGGDLAYANGDPRQIERWYDWFDGIMESLITPTNRMIPVLVTIGNHEVFKYERLERSGADLTEPMRKWGLEDRSARFFYNIFAMPGSKGWGVLDFNDYMSIFLLDSNYGIGTTNPGEPQTKWLKNALAERRNKPHLFPVYHAPAYPSVRSMEKKAHPRVRNNWAPLFQKNRVRVAFENHDHTYKRTYPMRDGEIHATGVVYIGDGAWGDVGVREIASRQEIGRDDLTEDEYNHWFRDGAEWPFYIKKGKSVRHFILVTIHGPHQHFIMIDNNNNVIDEYPATSRPETLKSITEEFD